MGALVFGLVVGVIAMAAWVSFESSVSRCHGRLAWVLGLLIALATVTGARGQTSFLIVRMCVALAAVAVAVVVGEYLILSVASPAWSRAQRSSSLHRSRFPMPAPATCAPIRCGPSCGSSR